MNTRKLRVALAALATAGLLTSGAWGQDVKRPADWERQASEYAVKAFAKSLASHPDAARANRQALDAVKVAPLPAELAAANAGRGLVLFRRSYARHVMRKVPPTVAEARGDRLSVSIARDEWEAVQLGIWALRDLPNVSVAVSDLIGSNGAGTIAAAKNVRRFFGFNLWTPVSQKRRPARPDGDIAVGEKIKFKKTFNEAPVALVDLASIDIPAGEARCVWLDIHIPKDAAAGRYTARVTVKVAGAVAAEAALTVRVHPFVLDQANEWGRGPFTSKLRTRRDLLHLREHGMNMMSWWTSASYTLKLTGGKIVAKFPRYIEYLKLLDECGYIHKHMVFMGGSSPKIQNRIFKILKRPTIGNARDRSAGPAFAKSDLSEPFGEYLCQALKQFHRQMTAAGHPELVACLLDEPDHNPRPQRPRWYNKMFALVEKGAPEVPLYGTFYHPGDEDRLSHHHKVWTTNRPVKRIAEKCKAAGRELRTYGGSGKYHQEPIGMRFRFGIMPWIFGAGGSYFWAYHWHSGDVLDPWSLGGLSTTSVHTPHGPLPTPMLKGGYREGIDDHRYIATLEKLIAKATASGGPAAKAEAGLHQRFLDSIRKPLYDKMTVRGGRPNFSAVGKLKVTGIDGTTAVLSGPDNTWAFAEFVRADVARRIVALTAKLR